MPVIKQYTGYKLILYCGPTPRHLDTRHPRHHLDTMCFTPSELEIKASDVVNFIVKNDEALKHEFVLGTPELLLEHAELMLKHLNMEHEEPYMAHVDPGKEMEVIWQFTESGTFEFGCLLPGHFQAGMKGTVKVI